MYSFKRWTGGLLVLALVLTGSAFAENRQEEQCQVTLDCELYVKNVVGSVKVFAWDKPTLMYKAEIGPKVERIDFDTSTSHPRIEVILPKKVNSGAYVHLEIYVPSGASVGINTISASILVEGPQGDLEAEAVSGSIDILGDAHSIEAKTVSGSVRIEGSAPGASIQGSAVSGSVQILGDADSIDATSVSGKVRVEGISKEARLKSTSGSVEYKGLSSELECESISGSIRVDRMQYEGKLSSVSGSIKIIGEAIEDLTAESVSGSITFEGTLMNNGSLEMQSRSGSVTAKLPSDTPAEYDLETFSGSIQNDFGPAPTKPRFGPGHFLEFTVGEGDASVELSSFSGGIRLNN